MSTETERFFGTRTFTEGKHTNKTVKIVTVPMDKEQARAAFKYRPATKYAESRFGGDGIYDDICLLLNGMATRCEMCQAPTKNSYLKDGTCPDCDGRSEANGTDPQLR